MSAEDRSRRPTSRQHVRLCIPGLAVRSKRWIEVDGRFAIGEGGGALLTAIDESGSLAQAARDIGWSYRHAWGYIRRAESVLGRRLVSTKVGKGASRGTLITDVARQAVATLTAAGSASE